ncbi:MAG: AAA family ATPase [Phycisphaerales bacterium]|nr:AAA family ATPase [Phycisphaerales bacterium]
MRIVALINQKGGCGKTTSSINLAACLAHLGQRTLLVDMDPQGHCAVGLAVPDQQIEKSIYNILRESEGAREGAVTIKEITWQIAGNFDLAPAAIGLAALETELHGIPGRQDRLTDALKRVQNDYDFCIIDCPPNVGLLTFNALRAASDVVIPVETGYFSLHGLAKQLELLEQLRKQCRQEMRIRILATLYDIRTKLAREVLAEMREQFGDMLMDATINFNTKLKEAASFGQPITEYDPASKGFKDFLKLAKELMGPTPRLTLEPGRAVEPVVAAEGEGESLENTVSQAKGTVEEMVELVREASEAGEAAKPAESTDNTTEHDIGETPGRRSSRWTSQAESLARRANEVKTAAQRTMGVNTQARQGTAQQKIEEFYGVRQLPEGLLFVAHFPNAHNVSIAGDFNNWTPQQMVASENEAADTFRMLVALKPGRYRYRLVVDGRWQSDPHNVDSEPNPYGELDSIVELI